MTHSFTCRITNPFSGDPTDVEVTYCITDEGVMGLKDERLVASLLSVTLGPEDILPRLSAHMVEAIQEQAYTHWRDQKDLARFGSEAI